jgi:hypothetical protein
MYRLILYEPFKIYLLLRLTSEGSFTIATAMRERCDEIAAQSQLKTVS